jgi:hypothetical protein
VTHAATRDPITVHVSPFTLPPPADAINRRRRAWTGAEEKRLRELYPKVGLAPCLDAFPDRTVSSIYARACQLGLTARLAAELGRRSTRPHTWRPDQDEAVRRAFTQGMGAVTRLCASLGRSYPTVRRRAAQLGVAVPKLREPVWTAAEDEHLRNNAHATAPAVRKSLALAGHRRTLHAIYRRRAHLGIDRAERAAAAENKGLFNTIQVAAIFGVHNKTVCLWIERGWLPAKRRNKVMWTIKARAIRDFVLTHLAHVDLRRVEAGGDKHLLFDIIEGRVEKAGA